ncbi:MAG: hypothetical protein AVDCRST_MAG54-3541, partial [uncultured Actinomycetospora sp.]
EQTAPTGPSPPRDRLPAEHRPAARTVRRGGRRCRGPRPHRGGRDRAPPRVRGPGLDLRDRPGHDVARGARAARRGARARRAPRGGPSAASDPGGPDL